MSAALFRQSLIGIQKRIYSDVGSHIFQGQKDSYPYMIITMRQTRILNEPERFSVFIFSLLTRIDMCHLLKG